MHSHDASRSRHTALRAEATRRSLVSLLATIVLTVIFPISYAIAGFYASEFILENGKITDNISELLGFFAPLSLMIVAHVCFLIKAYPRGTQALELIVENDDLLARNQDLAHEIESRDQVARDQAWLLTATEVLRGMVVGHVQRPVGDDGALREIVGELLSQLSRDEGRILGFGAGEIWRFSVYLYSSKREELLCAWTHKSRNHPSTGEPRCWKKNAGHIGQAFGTGKSQITEDTRTAHAQNVFGAPDGQLREYDSRAYVSFVSVPLRRHQNTNDVFGVLAVSSGVPSRFGKDEANAEKIILFAAYLSMSLSLCSVDIDDLRKA